MGAGWCAGWYRMSTRACRTASAWTWRTSCWPASRRTRSAAPTRAHCWATPGCAPSEPRCALPGRALSPPAHDPAPTPTPPSLLLSSVSSGCALHLPPNHSAACSPAALHVRLCMLVLMLTLTSAIALSLVQSCEWGDHPGKAAVVLRNSAQVPAELYKVSRAAGRQRGLSCKWAGV